MINTTCLLNLETQLTQHNISIDALLTFFQLATLDRSHPDWRTTLDDQICACIQILGGVREPDLIKITGVDQSTINRRVRALHKANTIQVGTYTTGSAGKPAKWLQPWESADLNAEQRADLITLAQIIIAYRTAWIAAQTPPAAPEPAPESVADQLPTVPNQPHEAATEEDPPPTSSTEAEQPPTEPDPPAEAIQPPAAPELPPQPAQPPIKRIPTPYPMPPAQPVALTVAAQSQPSFWYRSFYFWMTPLITLGIFSFVMNERTALVVFVTQMGIPLLWLIGASVLIALLLDHYKRIFASFYPVEHRALALTCGLIIAVAVVQSGLWPYARTLWTGTPTPDSQWVIPTMIPEPPALPETAIPRPTASCTHGGPARITALRGLRLRQYADTSAPVLATLPQDTLVTILCAEPIAAEDMQWVQIQYSEQIGWVAETVQGVSYLTRP